MTKSPPRVVSLTPNTPDIYTDLWFDKLCDRYDIPFDRRHEVRRSLELHAKQYLYFSERLAGLGKLSLEKSSLERVAKLAGKLRTEIANLDRASLDRLSLLDEDALVRAFTDPKANESRFGQRLIREVFSDGREVIVHLGFSDTLVAVEVLEAMATEAAFRTPPGKDGPRRDKLLWAWIVRLAELWRGRIGRRFTRRFYEGEPVSVAARFCVDVITAVAPDVSKKSISTQMRYVIEMNENSDVQKPTES